MTIIQNIINEIEQSTKGTYLGVESIDSKLNIEQEVAGLIIESDIAKFKAKLLTLKNETQNLVNNQELSVKLKEKQMDKMIKNSKKLFLQIINYIFNNPVKHKEFIIDNNDGVITLKGKLGYLFSYFSSQYGVDIEKTSQALSNTNKQSLEFHKDMDKKYFIEMYNKNYYMYHHEDSLI